MTVSAFDLGTHGPAAVSPERLISFSKVPIIGSTPVVGGVAPPPGIDTTRYRFRINPDGLQTRHNVVENYEQTQFAWERQDWGNGLSIFSYQGTTGVFRPDVDASTFASLYPNGFDIRQTKAWQAFREFEVFYRTNRGTNVRMFYDLYDHEWEGSLSEFSFNRAVDRPFLIAYTFTFTGLPFDYTTTTVNVTTSTGSSAADQQLAASATPFLGSASTPIR